jgi:hypothetical protein
MNDVRCEIRVNARTTTNDDITSDLTVLSAPAAPVTPTPNTGFDYAAFAPADAAQLRNHAARLRGLITKSTADMIEIGGDLLTIKGRLEHGQFTKWIEREIGISIRTAQTFIAAAKLAVGKSETVALLPPSTVRILAAKSAPLEIVEHIIARVGSGEIVTDAAVKDMIHTDRMLKWQAKEATEAAKRRSKAGRAARDKKAADEQPRLEAAREQEKVRIRTAAQSIVDRFSPEDARFIADTLEWDILSELKRLVAEGAA